MPELPEVEILRRGMEHTLLGRRFAQVTVSRHDLRCPVPDNLASLLVGKICRHVRRRGKYILLYLQPEGVLVIHLGMSGQILMKDVGTRKHEHVFFRMDGGMVWSYRDVRRFGSVTYMNEEEIKEYPPFERMGIEPLSKELTGRSLYKLAQSHRQDMKGFLLNQHYVAGLGNIYVCESLFESGISPFLQASKMTLDQACRLVRAIKKVLRAAVKGGGSSIKDCVHLDGSSGHFQMYHRVYGRAGLSCSAGHVCSLLECPGVQAVKQSGRTTFYCPIKQAVEGVIS